jgi:hypothetical protein
MNESKMLIFAYNSDLRVYILRDLITNALKARLMVMIGIIIFFKSHV